MNRTLCGCVGDMHDNNLMMGRQESLLQENNGETWGGVGGTHRTARKPINSVGQLKLGELKGSAIWEGGGGGRELKSLFIIIIIF